MLKVPLKELAINEQKLPVSGSGRKLVLALKSKLIRDASFDEVKDVLRKVLYKLGVRENNWPNDIEKLVLFEHIVENYGGNRVDEIRLAFDMAISNGLPDEHGEMIDANSYENFSCLYFSKIMNAYRRWSAQEYKIEVKPDDPEQKIFTDEEIDNAAREAVQCQYKQYIKGFGIINHEINKPILLKDGLIKEDETVLDFYKRMVELKKLDVYVRE